MNWFERHLNWSLVLGLFYIPANIGLTIGIIASIFIIIAGLVSYGFGPGFLVYLNSFEENAGGTGGIVYSIVVLLLCLVGVIILTFWYLGKKGRSKGFVLLLIAPPVFGFFTTFLGSPVIILAGVIIIFVGSLIGLIILLLLKNQNLGYGGDFSDHLTREPATDRWPDTRQYGTPNDWRPKDLDYSPQKSVESLAFGGTAKGVGDVGVPSGEVPAEPPEAVPPKDPADVSTEVPLEPPATYIQEELTTEIPAESSEGAIEESPAEVLEEVPKEISTESAVTPVAETVSSQPVSQMPILMDDTGAVIKCFYHSEAEAVSRCSRCGQYVCSHCNYVTGTNPICRNCWDRRTEVPLSVVSAGKQESPRSGKPDKSKAGKEERAREFVRLYEQALPVINAVITRGPDGLTASPLDLAEGLKLRPMLEYAKKLPKLEGKELQEAKKEFEQLCTACIKIAEKAADFFSAGGQTIPTEEDFARLVDSIEKASALMSELYPKMASLSQPQA